MELRVNDARHLLAEVEDASGRHYFVDGITDVLDPHAPLKVLCMSKLTTVHPDLLELQPDTMGNLTISLPLDESTSLFIRGVLPVDETLMTVLTDTPLFSLVKDRMGWLAVAGYEILCKL